MKEYDYLVLGGGISGLSYAHFLAKEGHSVKLLEASDQFGGIMKTVNKDGFTFETGPNTVVNRTPGIKALIKDLDLEEKLIYPSPHAAAERYILFNDVLHQLPTSPLSILSSSFFTFSEKLNILGEFFKKSLRDLENTTVKEFFKERFGEGVYLKVVVPFLSGIYAGDPAQQPMKFALPEILKMQQKQGSVLKALIKKQKKSDKAKGAFFTLPGGLGMLPKKIEEAKPEVYQKNAKVVKVEKQNGVFKTTYLQDGKEEVFSSKKVVSTIPLHALQLILDTNLSPEKLDAIFYAPVINMQFAFKKEQIQNFPKGFGVLPLESEKKSFLGILFNSNFFPQQAKENHYLMTVIAGGMMHKEIGLMEEEALKNQLLEEVNQLFKINGAPVSYHFSRWSKGIPQFTENHSKVINQIHQLESKNEGLYIGGNFLNGPSVSNCIDKAFNFVESQKN